MAPYDKTAAIDHVVVLVFENRSFDNLLRRLYGAARPVSRWSHGRAMGRIAVDAMSHATWPYES